MGSRSKTNSYRLRLRGPPAAEGLPSHGLHRSPLRRGEEASRFGAAAALPSIQELRGSSQSVGAGRLGRRCQARGLQDQGTRAAQGGGEEVKPTIMMTMTLRRDNSLVEPVRDISDAMMSTLVSVNTDRSWPEHLLIGFV